jgi:patatin-related protein
VSEKVDEELRIALSMRGGVSLAVWIGGAVEEIDRLTRSKAQRHDPAKPLGPTGFYSALLEMAGYSRAALDVITGASAGGLNGVVLAASRAYGFQFEQMLRIWVEVADIELLSRDPSQRYPDEDHETRRSRRPKSLLQGDEYFLAQLQKHLAALLRGSSGDHCVADPFDLILSATLVNPAYESRDDDPFSPITEVRRSAQFQFRFVGDIGDNGGDFQAREQAMDESHPGSTARLLALAGRATSSFPVAFEAATVDGSAARVFSDAPGGADDPVHVLDGGVLDNIPVSKAIEAIANAPVPRKADRWLVFLHPSPPSDSKPTSLSTLKASPRALKMLLTTTSVAFGQESLLDDLDQLEDHNREAARQRLRRDAMVWSIWQRAAADLGSHLDEARTKRRSLRIYGGKLQESLLLVGSAYRPDIHRVRARLDSARVERILEGGVRVRRPLGDGADRVKDDDWLRAVRARLGVDVQAAWEAAFKQLDGPDRFHLRPDGTVNGAVLLAPGSLLLACDLVARWVRAIPERPLPPGEDPDDTSVIRLSTLSIQLSELRRIIVAAVNWADQVWLVAASRGPAPNSAWATDAVTLIQQLLRNAPEPELKELQKAFKRHRHDPDCASAEIAKALAELDKVVRGEIRASCRGTGSDGPNLVKWIWDQLVEIVGLAARRGATQGVNESPDKGPYGELGPEAAGHSPEEADATHVILGLAGQHQDPAITSDVLGALVTVLIPLQASELESDEEVRFLRIAGSNSTPLKPLLVSKKTSKRFDVRDKLCGNELGNFAAFLSARWRINDWMWGRLDAVKSIVDLLIRPERLNVGGIPKDDLITSVRVLATSSGMTLSDATVEQIEQEISAALICKNPVLDMSTTRATLTEAMQRRIFAELLPLVDHATEHPVWPSDVREPSAALSTEEAVTQNDLIASHHVGNETIGDLDSRRRTQIGMRLALVAFLALKPERRPGRPRLARGLMTLLKPFYIFAAFTALNVARGIFVLTLTAVGFYIGPWRLRDSEPETRRGWDLLNTLHGWWPDRDDWWSAPVRPNSFWPWLGAVVLVTLGILAIVLLVDHERKRGVAKRTGRPIPDGRIWYVGTLLLVGVATFSSASGICLGAMGILIGSMFIGRYASAWMRPRWSIAMGFITGVAYALTGLAFWGFSHWVRDGEPWFGYTGWMSVVALYFACSLVAISCTWFRVLPNAHEIRKKALGDAVLDA